MRIRLTALLLSAFTFLSILFSSNVWAMHAGMGSSQGETLLTIDNSTIPISFRASAEYLWGKSDEYVFDADTGQKISHLEWDLKDIVMLGGVFSTGISDWIQLNVGGWGAVSDGSGRIVDRDWEGGNPSEWSDRSEGPCSLDHGYIIDSNIAFPVEVFKYVTISPMIGFKYDNWKWHDRGGIGVYSGDGWRDTVINFGDKTGLVYEQWFYAPYLGVNVGGNYEDFFVNAYFKGTPWAWSEDEDHHLERSRKYTEKVYNQTFIGAGIELGCNLNENLFVVLGFDFQEFQRAKGSTEMTNTETGETATLGGDAAGIGHSSSAVNISFGFKF